MACISVDRTAPAKPTGTVSRGNSTGIRQDYLLNVKSRANFLTLNFREFVINKFRSMVFLCLYQDVIRNRIFYLNQKIFLK